MLRLVTNHKFHSVPLQSVPGTLCSFCKVSRGHFAVSAKCPRDTLQICKVSRGHFADLQSVPGTLCIFYCFRGVCWVLGAGGEMPTRSGDLMHQSELLPRSEWSDGIGRNREENDYDG